MMSVVTFRFMTSRIRLSRLNSSVSESLSPPFFFRSGLGVREGVPCLLFVASLTDQLANTDDETKEKIQKLKRKNSTERYRYRSYLKKTIGYTRLPYLHPVLSIVPPKS
jgi:hypothetical protein